MSGVVSLMGVLAFSPEGVEAVLYYLMAYTVSNALAFGSLIYMGSRGKEAVSYEDLAGDGRLMNVTDLAVHALEVFGGNAGLISTSADFAAAKSIPASR